jgi:hypothetical protein
MCHTLISQAVIESCLHSCRSFNLFDSAMSALRLLCDHSCYSFIDIANLHTVRIVLNLVHALQAVIPQSAVEHVTLRLTEGKAVLVGGLAKIELISGKPFLFTFFISNQVSNVSAKLRVFF